MLRLPLWSEAGNIQSTPEIQTTIRYSVKTFATLLQSCAWVLLNTPAHPIASPTQLVNTSQEAKELSAIYFPRMFHV